MTAIEIGFTIKNMLAKLNNCGAHMFSIKSFKDTVKEMKSFGEFLIPYNRPKVTQQDEDEVNFLKAREAIVDGYHLVLYYSKSDWDTHYLEVVQATGRYTPFLPFSLVCKIGKRFLGDQQLSYLDSVSGNKKTYCWTVAKDKSNNPIPAPYKKEALSDECVFEGLCYKRFNN